MTLLLFIIILSILVFVHEVGHFLVAKRAGIRVLEFGFGLPPRVIGKKIGETVYSLNLLPIGGFVRLFGEDSEEASRDDRPEEKDGGIDAEGEHDAARAFFSQPKRVRTAVILAGAAMNLLLGVVLFSSLYSILGIPTLTQGVQVVEIFKDSPAQEAFVPGDEVLSVAGQEVETTKDFQEIVEERKGEEVSFTVLRDGNETRVAAVPRVEPPTRVGPAMLTLSEGWGVACRRSENREGALGVVIAPKTEMVRYALWQMPLRGAWFGLGAAYNWGSNIVRGLGTLVAQLLCGTVPADVGGPVEIAYLVSEVSRAGLVPLVNLVAILSINLAVINLLPIPALDGGRLLFISVESVIGKRVSARAERISHAVGMALLLALMLAITVQDVLRRVGVERLDSLVERVTGM